MTLENFLRLQVLMHVQEAQTVCLHSVILLRFLMSAMLIRKTDQERSVGWSDRTWI